MVSDITDLLLAVWSRFLSISLLVYFLSAQSGQEVYCEDWLQLYLRCCFSPILFSVNAVFRLSAGNYCLPRLQPNIHSWSLCLSLLIWRTKLFLGASEGFSNGCTFEIQSEQLLSSRGIEGELHDSKRFLMTLSLTPGTGWWIIQWDSCLKHGYINGASAGCLQYAGFATKAWLSYSHYNLTGVNFKEVNEENKQKLFGEIYTAIDTLAFTFGNV